jgi:hypothetical protein
MLGVSQMEKRIILASALAAILLVPSYAMADSITPFGSTTGSGPFVLTSSGPLPSTTYSGVDVTLSTPIAFSSISSLSASFTDNTGGADGGSPRFELDASNNDFFLVYLGTPPNFSDSDPVAFTTAFSGTNLNNGTNNSAIGNGNTFVTLASLEAAFGADMITDISLITDGGWATNGAQSLTLKGIDLNGEDLLAATPLPATLPLFAGGLAFVGYLTRRKKRAQAVTAA